MLEKFEFLSPVEMDYEGHAIKKVNLKWQIEPEIRAWGIKDFCIYVPPQTISIFYTIDADEDYNKRTDHEVDVEIDNPKIQDECSGIYRISPTLVEVYRGKVTVYF